MGTVYLAEHSVMGWPAAIKVLRRALADDKVLVKRFINEARVIRAVRHPNIVEILDVGILPAPDERPYLLMELLEGETLGQRLDRVGPLPVRTALDLACQTALALAEAHGKGITHRDLKPDNLFLVRDPDDPARDKVKVLDFGIAKLRDGDGQPATAHTRSGMLLGTPKYMSPEQCRGLSAAVDHRTDIYALSVILYQMLAGKVPFTSAGTGDVLIMHVSAEPPRIGQEQPGVPAFVEAAILRGMAKLREQRFQSMTEFAEALRRRPEDTIDLQLPPPAPLRPTAPLPTASVATPLSWSGARGDTTWFMRGLSWRAKAIAAAGATTVLVLFIAAGRWIARDRVVDSGAAGRTQVDVVRVPAAAAARSVFAPAPVLAPADASPATAPPIGPPVALPEGAAPAASSTPTSPRESPATASPPPMGESPLAAPPAPKPSAELSGSDAADPATAPAPARKSVRRPRPAAPIANPHPVIPPPPRKAKPWL
jgi:tRNA A-37 threonylcarbamoyl transferase component Bud32